MHWCRVLYGSFLDNKKPTEINLLVQNAISKIEVPGLYADNTSL